MLPYAILAWLLSGTPEQCDARVDRLLAARLLTTGMAVEVSGECHAEQPSVRELAGRLTRDGMAKLRAAARKIKLELEQRR